MYRVTTPTHKFIVPFNASTIDKLILTYSQAGNTVLEKRENEVTFSGKTVVVTLTQEETARFDIRYKVDVQLRVKIGEKVIASNILTISVDKVLNEEVM